MGNIDSSMSVPIAIPEPTSRSLAYNGRSLQAYLDALERTGALPVVIRLKSSQEEVARKLSGVQGVLLPGSRFDVDPQTYGEDPIPECAKSDRARIAVDELLLQDAFNLQKPILAICYGIQALNVWRNGTLYQDIDTQLGRKIDHRPGRNVEQAHAVAVASGSRIAAMAHPDESQELWVNSSHHQAVHRPGDNLLVTAVSPEDGVIEAVELDSADHFVLGVQWHPERTFAESALSRAIFETFVEEAKSWEPRRIEESVARG